MSLKKKVILITAAVMILTMSVSYTVSVFYQTSALRVSDETRAKTELEMFLSNLDFTRRYYEAGAVSEQTQNVIDAFFFSRVAAFGDGTSSWYSLADLQGNYLYNRCPEDPLSLSGFLQQVDLSEVSALYDTPLAVRRVSSGRSLLILCTPSNIYTDRLILLTKDVSETEALIRRVRLISALMLFLAVSLSVLLLFCLLRKTLTPIETLTENARAIAEGDYSLRTSYTSDDEIGSLSRAFDKMADAVEEKITSLDTELDRKELLLGALSHELKTPVTSIIGYAESLLYMPLDPGMQKTSALRILEAGKHAENLSQKLMEIIGLSRDASLEKTVFRAADLVDALSGLFPEHVSFSVSLKVLYGDKTLLLSLVSNLLQNALKNIPEETSPDVRVSFFPENDMDVIRVRDNGIGIPEEHIPYLTDPFYRVDKDRSRKTGGVGLGLSLVKMITDLHGGTLTIESTPGEGTCISVRLPRKEENT